VDLTLAVRQLGEGWTTLSAAGLAACFQRWRSAAASLQRLPEQPVRRENIQSIQGHGMIAVMCSCMRSAHEACTLTIAGMYKVVTMKLKLGNQGLHILQNGMSPSMGVWQYGCMTCSPTRVACEFQATYAPPRCLVPRQFNKWLPEGQLQDALQQQGLPPDGPLHQRRLLPAAHRSGRAPACLHLHCQNPERPPEALHPCSILLPAGARLAVLPYHVQFTTLGLATVCMVSCIKA